MAVIDAVMTPTNGHGYWFADPGDYSGYGILSRVRECVGMTWIPDLLNNLQGRMTRGTMVHLRGYNYDAGAGPVQTDMPTYTLMDETFVGQGYRRSGPSSQSNP